MFHTSAIASAFRTTLPTLALAITGFTGTVGPAPAEAAAPMMKTQAPGFFRVMLGDFEVTAINDGTVMLDVAKLPNRQPGRKPR